MIALAAVSSTVSQLNLSPVYGSLPSGLYHQHGVAIATLTGWLAKNRIKPLASGNFRYLIPVLAFCIPTIQFFLFRQSTKLGAVKGPLITEGLTLYPVVFLSTAAAAFLLENVALPGYNRIVKEHGGFVVAFILSASLRQLSNLVIPQYMGASILFTRIGLQFFISTLYAISLPSKYLLLAVPSLLFTGLFNVHVPLGHNTALLNATLQQDNFVLLERQESLTGYISVLENLKDHYKVMRCDHSLLGGDWTWDQFPEARVAEPIYVVFTMLEAVRLILQEDGSRRKADKDSNALLM
jgi:hypothetical protein